LLNSTSFDASDKTNVYEVPVCWFKVKFKGAYVDVAVAEESFESNCV
jgi:hypothetical protein